jgi:enolase
MSTTEIVAVRGRRVWDSRGKPTVEAEVKLASGAIGRAIAPAGASTGSGEAIDLRDGGSRFGGADVMKAVNNVNGEIARALRGHDARDQKSIDDVLIALDGTPNKARLGANAMVATSMGVLHAAAAGAHMPLYAYLLGDRTPMMPIPEIQIFGGGAHAGRRVDIQDFMIVAPKAVSFAEALEWTAEVYRAAGAMMSETGRLQGVADEGGFWPAFDSNEAALDALVGSIERAGFTPGDDISISLDIASSEFYRDGAYRLALDGRVLDSDAMSAMLIDWLDRYPIVSIEDPLAEHDEAGLTRFTKAVGHRVQIVGDDFLVTDAARLRRAAAMSACNAILVKPNQVGTVSEALAAIEGARSAQWGSIISARSGETEDVTIVHLAVGWGVLQLKVGSFSRSERMAKWNEALRIEEALDGRAAFAGDEPWSHFVSVSCEKPSPT